MTAAERAANVEYMRRLARRARSINPREVLRRTGNRVTAAWATSEFDAIVLGLRDAARKIRTGEGASADAG